MFTIRASAMRLVAKYNETESVSSRKTGILVDVTEDLNGDLIASPHVAAGTKPTGFLYKDPQTKSRDILLNGSAGDAVDTIVDDDYCVVATQAGWGLTNQVADGDYSSGTSLTVDDNARLKVAGEGDSVFAKVLKGATVARQNKSIEILFDF